MLADIDLTATKPWPNFKLISFCLESLLITNLTPCEDDFIIKNFIFNSGETLPELRLHYTTLGSLKRDDKGHALNAVLLLHGTTGVGQNFLNPSLADYLFGPSQPLDATNYFIIMPDGIGRGKSSKPSDGMRAKFPHYGYHDMVRAQYRLIKEGLGIDHLKLVLGTSMGGMHSWLWAEHYPTIMDAVMPICCLPVAITGRNFLWRHLIMEAIKNDPDYNNGDYKTQPKQYQRVLSLFNLFTTSVKDLEALANTQEKAKTTFAHWVENFNKVMDANDYLYWFEAISDYDPEPHLDKIQAKVLAVNVEDDLLTPIELKTLERTMPKVKNGAYVIIPQDAGTKAHQSNTQACLWAKYLQELLSFEKHMP